MIEGKSVLAVIPARGGSKGLPGKNIAKLAGKPLIAWTIEEARKSRYIDRLVLTTDDKLIMAVARRWKCEVPFTRPPELSRDETPGIEPIMHAVRMCPGYDYVVKLQPTSPLRTVEDIDGCIEACARAGADSCVTVTEAGTPPQWMYNLDGQGRLSPLAGTTQSNRQDLPRPYALNGAVYVARRKWLQASRSFVCEGTLAHVMPAHRSVDIDTGFDLFIAEACKVKELTLDGG